MGGRWGKTETETDINLRETHRLAASHPHLDDKPGIEPTTEVPALDRELNP